jgi:hypothetical protein
MPANADFARFNFQVPTAGSATDPAAMTALPLVRSAPRNALERIFFTNVFLRLVFRLLVVLLWHSVSAAANAVVASRAPVATTARMLKRAFISFSSACLGGLRTLFHDCDAVAHAPA